MTTAPQPTIFIVDDDEAVRDALAILIRASEFEVETFASANAFLARHDARRPGCLVLDVRMPGMSGLELLDELRRRRIALPVVFLTGHGDVPMAVRAMQCGADDFILKPVNEQRLLLAIMNALRRHGAGHKGATTAPAPSAGVPSGKLASLSPRERQVLELIVAGKLSAEIASELCISLKTVEFHRANIRTRLGVTSLPELCRLVLLGDRA